MRVTRPSFRTIQSARAPRRLLLVSEPHAAVEHGSVHFTATIPLVLLVRWESIQRAQP